MTVGLGPFPSHMFVLMVLVVSVQMPMLCFGVHVLKLDGVGRGPQNYCDAARSQGDNRKGREGDRKAEHGVKPAMG